MTHQEKSIKGEEIHGRCLAIYFSSPGYPAPSKQSYAPASVKVKADLCFSSNWLFFVTWKTNLEEHVWQTAGEVHFVDKYKATCSFQTLRESIFLYIHTHPGWGCFPKYFACWLYEHGIQSSNLARKAGYPVSYQGPFHTQDRKQDASRQGFIPAGFQFRPVVCPLASYI